MVAAFEEQPIQAWRVGKIEIAAIREIDLEFQAGGPNTIIPDASSAALALLPDTAQRYLTAERALKLRVQAILVKTETAAVVIDPGVGNGRHRPSAAFHMLKTHFLEVFRGFGWRPDDVTHVINTHLHMDHVGWNTMEIDGAWKPAFPSARYSISRRDYEYYRDSGDEHRLQMIADSIAPIIDAGLADFVEPDAAILPGVRLMPTLGHSPGHASVIIESEGERAVISGDVMHHPSQIFYPGWSSSLDTDQCMSRETRVDFLKQIANTRTLLIGTHFSPPSAGYVTSAGDLFQFHPVS